MPRKILVTSALPYANGSIHLGHLVEYIQTDIWVRFQKMQGNEVHYVCADDTHGTPVMLRADSEGIAPEELIARVYKEHTRDFAGFHVQFDNYYTTNSRENQDFCNDIYAQLEAKDLIAKRSVEQFVRLLDFEVVNVIASAGPCTAPGGSGAPLATPTP